MEMLDPIEINSFGAVTIGILVYFLGARLTRRYAVLSKYSIPEPVSGGLLAAILALLVVLATGRAISYELSARDFLLVYFFTTVGLNARFADLIKGFLLGLREIKVLRKNFLTKARRLFPDMFF